jgi:hypothetical protein
MNRMKKILTGASLLFMSLIAKAQIDYPLRELNIREGCRAVYSQLAMEIAEQGRTIEEKLAWAGAPNGDVIYDLQGNAYQYPLPDGRFRNGIYYIEKYNRSCAEATGRTRTGVPDIRITRPARGTDPSAQDEADAGEPPQPDAPPNAPSRDFRGDKLVDFTGAVVGGSIGAISGSFNYGDRESGIVEGQINKRNEVLNKSANTSVPVIPESQKQKSKSKKNEVQQAEEICTDPAICPKEKINEGQMVYRILDL